MANPSNNPHKAQFYVFIRTPNSAGRYGQEGYDRGWLINTEPKTLKDALQTVNWQHEGGCDPQAPIICTKAGGLAGIMEHTPEGTTRPVLIEQGPRTLEAFHDQCLSLWGDLV